ncbi:hypothetical protein A8709_26490 [Paenibacillus pectinilyticus]|uniref:Uncharacterized protein n=1 Tax=Paenibacillus pectinilyticus TaxID=512399 RepID=A0A1C1A1G4_9BACL|nr:hypothetical protein A8709_26490 [Paenibacillus pectinilyticus]
MMIQNEPGRWTLIATSSFLCFSGFNILPSYTGLYIIQRAIDIAKINARPFDDIRIMMMRNDQNQWQYAGMLAKVARRSSVITNVTRGGGYATPIEHALDTSLRLSHNQNRNKELFMNQFVKVIVSVYDLIATNILLKLVLILGSINITNYGSLKSIFTIHRMNCLSNSKIKRCIEKLKA